MKRVIYDTETNGLLDEVDQMHCLVLVDIDDGTVLSCADQPGYVPIADGLRVLEDAELIVGHNSIKFDVPVIKKLYPWWNPKGVRRDSILCARIAWPDIGDGDQARIEKQSKIVEHPRPYPRNLVGRYSLEAFGHRLGDYKGDYKGPWDLWSKEMQDYCVQDVRVTRQLWLKLAGVLDTYGMSSDDRALDWWMREAVTLEHSVAEITFRQEQYGFAFDVDKAADLYGTLAAHRMELEDELRTVFPAWWKPVVEKTQAADVNRKRQDLEYSVVLPRFGKTGKALKPYEGPVIETTFEGAQFTKVDRIEFNCKSRHHIANRLIKLRGWKPKEFTPSGEPKIDDEVLGALKYPEAKKLAEYLMIQKRIGMISEGRGAWLHYERHGRIHGTVVSCGTPTARMTHNSPNVAQVPSSKSPYGKECRELFTTTAGYRLVGCDADALELRDLAGYMAKWDGGAYVEAVLRGRKEDGTDIHSVNCRALGMDPKVEREIAKRWFYAFIYGAGDEKLGIILGGKTRTECRSLGKQSRADFLKNLPALGAITKAVRAKAIKAGRLRALDGRMLRVRSAHSALNTLLQSAGAIQMKRALVILDTTLQEVHGLTPGVDYEFVANVHDEWQIEVLPQHVELVKDEATHSIEAAGVYYNFGCPLKGNAQDGATWAETH